VVGTIKRWLGIEALERENLILAKSVFAMKDRISALESVKPLTSEPKPPKIVAKRTIPRHVNWKQARAAYERASTSEDESNG